MLRCYVAVVNCGRTPSLHQGYGSQVICTPGEFPALASDRNAMRSLVPKEPAIFAIIGRNWNEEILEDQLILGMDIRRITTF
jgi:hypothetical protein